jgi:hypothetical protein
MILSQCCSRVSTRDQSEALKKYKINLLRRYIIEYLKSCGGTRYLSPIFYYDLGGGYFREWNTFHNINEISGTHLPIEIELNYSGPENSYEERQTDKLVEQLKAIGYIHEFGQKDPDFESGGGASYQLTLKF